MPQCTLGEIATRQSRISTQTKENVQIQLGDAKPRANTASNGQTNGDAVPKRSIPELVRFMNGEALDPRSLTHAIHDVPVHRTCHGLVYVFRHVVAV